MSRVVLDTSVLIAEDVEPIAGELAISVISVAELNFGVLVARDGTVRAERLRRLAVLQRRFEPLPLDEAVADSFGQLAAQVVLAGRSPRSRVMDLLIAATAHAHDAAVGTKNPEDLAGLEDLITVIPV